MARVLHPGGVLTGSALLNDTGLRYLPVRQVGRLAGLLGPGADHGRACARWLTEAGLEDVTLELSGAIGYFRGREGLRGAGFPGDRDSGRTCIATYGAPQSQA